MSIKSWARARLIKEKSCAREEKEKRKKKKEKKKKKERKKEDGGHGDSALSFGSCPFLKASLAFASSFCFFFNLRRSMTECEFLTPWL